MLKEEKNVLDIALRQKRISSVEARALLSNSTERRDSTGELLNCISWTYSDEGDSGYLAASIVEVKNWLPETSGSLRTGDIKEVYEALAALGDDNSPSRFAGNNRLTAGRA
jgi:hypothetical protein